MRRAAEHSNRIAPQLNDRRCSQIARSIFTFTIIGFLVFIFPARLLPFSTDLVEFSEWI